MNNPDAIIADFHNQTELASVPAPTMEQASSKYIDFNQIDSIRKRMLLSVDSLATLFGITRVTYYNWMSGVKPRKPKQLQVRKVMRNLATAVAVHNWPTEEAFQVRQPERLKMLQELLASLDKEPEQQ